MARIRYIKPDTFSDTDLSEVSIPARLLYVALWCFMDIQGITEDDAKLIKRNVYPYDDSITSKKVELLIQELVVAGFIFRFEHDGKKLLFCPTLSKHQKFHHKEHVRFEIPKEKLIALVKTEASPGSAPYQPPSSRMGNGELVMGNGQLATENGETVEPKKGSPVSVLPEFQDSLTDEFLGNVKIEVQRAWLQTYPDTEWIKFVIKKAVTWTINNPAKAPKSRHGSWLSQWLAKDWEQYRKGIKTETKTGLDIWRENMEKELGGSA